MSVPKLYQNLALIPPKDLERFTQFLHSPYHHLHAETRQLWKVLATHHPGFEVTDETLFDTAFPGKQYDNARLRVLRTYLFDLLEQFLAQEELQSNPRVQARLVRMANARLSLPNISGKYLSHKEEPQFQNTSQALEEFFLMEDELRTSIRSRNRGEKRDFPRIMHPLDVYYLSHKLRFFCVMTDPSAMQSGPHDIPGLEEMLALCEVLDLTREPLIAVYYHLLLMFLDRDREKNLQIFTRLLREHGSLLDSFEKGNCYLFLVNFYFAQMASGIPGALQRLFTLYQQMADMSVFFDQESVTAIHLRNMVKVAAMLKEFNWAWKQIRAYENHLSAEWRDNVIAYCKASLYMEDGEYKEAKRFLLNARLQGVQYETGRQVMLLRIYFEENDLEGFESVKTALKTYLHRNQKIPLSTRNSLKNLLRFSSRLFHLRDMKTRALSAANLLREITECKSLSERVWLVSRTEAIISISASWSN